MRTLAELLTYGCSGVTDTHLQRSLSFEIIERLDLLLERPHFDPRDEWHYAPKNNLVGDNSWHQGLEEDCERVSCVGLRDPEPMVVKDFDSGEVRTMATFD